MLSFPGDIRSIRNALKLFIHRSFREEAYYSLIPGGEVNRRIQILKIRSRLFLRFIKPSVLFNFNLYFKKSFFFKKMMIAFFILTTGSTYNV
tara:strand:- start:946 stop:1221 length:276 start_codon:yes stop_codon:yes gene_type:complete